MWIIVGSIVAFSFTNRCDCFLVFKIKLEIIRSGSATDQLLFLSYSTLYCFRNAFGYPKNKLRYILTSALTGYTFKLGIAILLTP
jgi:hypothetical protein